MLDEKFFYSRKGTRSAREESEKREMMSHAFYKSSLPSVRHKLLRNWFNQDKHDTYFTVKQFRNISSSLVEVNGPMKNYTVRSRV
jgi:hypothetical protein